MKNDLSFSEMLEMQRELWELHKNSWSPMEPKFARNSLLWMIGEIGEVIDIIKKCGEDRIMEEEDIRKAFTEELCDVQMYFNDVMLRYGITPENISQAYIQKHNKNILRSYESERDNFAKKLRKDE